MSNRNKRTFYRCFLPSFDSFGQTVSQEKNLKNQPIRNKNRLWRPCLLMDRDKMSNLYREPSNQFSVHLAKRFQRRFFRNQPIRNKICLWRPCLLMDRDKMSNRNKRTFHRCFLPSFDSFGQTVSQEKNLKYQPIRNKNRLWRPCLLTD